MTAEEFEYELFEIQQAVREEKELASTIGLLDMFRGSDLRRTLPCFAMIACQTGSGVWFFIGYSTYFFTIANVPNPFVMSIVMTCCGFFGVNVGMYCLRKLPRRYVLIGGALGCGVKSLILAAVSSELGLSVTAGKVIVAMNALFQVFYNGGVGVASYPVAGELVSHRLRAYTLGTATGLGCRILQTISLIQISSHG